MSSENVLYPDRLHQLRESIQDHLCLPLHVDVGDGHSKLDSVMDELQKHHPLSLDDLLTVPSLIISYQVIAAKEQSSGDSKPPRKSRKRPLDVQTEQPRTRNHPMPYGKVSKMQPGLDVNDSLDVESSSLNDNCEAERLKKCYKINTFCQIC